ncbi:adhesion G protein-coupled receptor F5 isoform X1 [Ictalurus punctatus]|uniref:Adhesion G protein-coupled receptor F5 isoform X1 n=1 Tax=Ictalurus punctatus TaxID=7998 RepID=A0A2D0SPG6_ICTPU|nr:adhesion G protein-coupled receptor F5 isoform X1 [Ictalurus punctatus]
MANKGKISKDDLLRFVAILLIHIQMMNSQVLPEISDTELSYTDEQMNHIREKRDVNTDIVEYIFIVDVNVPQVILMDQIKSLVASKSPIQADNSTKIDALNLTAMCQQNESEYLCTFDDQYVLPYNNCLTYNACDNPDEATCTCINASHGQICVSKNEVPPPTTTPAAPTKTTTTTTITTTTTTTVVRLLSFSLTINRRFDFALTETSSETYKTYKKDIQSSINESYKSVPGYKPNSANVTKFRPGSVIVDFTIEATSDNLNLDSANKQLASSLRSQGYSVSDNASSQIVNGGLYNSSDYIYPDSTLKLTCNPPENNDITWKMNNNKLVTSDKYTVDNLILTVNRVTPADSGLYECSTTVNSVPYVIRQSITIQPYPDIQITLSKVVKCENTAIPLQCCFQGMYKGNWSTACRSTAPVTTGCISCDYEINKQTCQNNDQVILVTCQLTPLSGSTTQRYSKNISINVQDRGFSCFDTIFGAGDSGAISIANCTGDMVGNQTAKCNSSGHWDIIENNCIPRIFQTLINDAKILQIVDIPQFMTNLSSATVGTQNVTTSPATILTIVEILNTISELSSTVLVNQPIMKDFLQIVDVIGAEGARNTWVSLNTKNTTLNASSELLKSTEDFARRLRDENMNITTNTTSLSKTNITAPFSGTFGKNLTTQINIPVTGTQTPLTVIISSAFNNILPVRSLTNNDSNQTGTSINGDVVLIETTSTINNISLSIDIKNNTLGNPQCVFWNFNLLNDIGGWDSTGCQLKKLGNETERITCECNHTTSFSILMSPFTLDKKLAIILDYITYIGVAISLGSLVLCLIIEMIIWKSVTRNDTSYMRHVSIVNIAVSLLIANICFLIGAAVVKKGVGPCSTATFFMHFFYLALFFWMLLSALLLLYRTLMVFSRMSKGAMMAIAFTVGYGAPLIIAVITVASTAGSQGYIQKDYNCWLNWSKTKALLAFVIPALTIVAINLLVLIVVLCKMLRRGVNATTQPDEKHPLLIIARCVAILTPLFGLTWGFGIGTMVSPNFGIHVVFAFLNSLQGFFILMFGTLLDSKVREALARTFSLSNLSSIRTRSTSAGPSSSSGFPFFQRLRQRNVYNVSSAEMSSSNSDTATDSYAARPML